MATTRMVPATPGELLVAAEQILSTPPGNDDDEMTARAPWICALLIKLALEAVLDGYWRRMAPSAVNCSIRAQLLLLPDFKDTSTAKMARDSWLGLSRASDQRGDEAAPTETELRGWHSSVAAVTAELS